MAKYAANTDVSSDRSRAEIERTLERYGARQFIYGWDQDRALVGFVLNDREIRFVLPLPLWRLVLASAHRFSCGAECLDNR